MRFTKVALPAVLSALALAAASAQTRQATNRPPTVKLRTSTDRMVVVDGCVEPLDPECTPPVGTIQLSAEATDPDGNRLLYSYSATGGRVTGDGPEAALDMKGVTLGIYKVTVKVDDSRGGVAFDEATVTVAQCICDPTPPPLPPCPTVTVSCPDVQRPGEPVTYTASVKGGDPAVTPTFKWEVSAGSIASGQGTASITVDMSNVPGGLTMTGTVDVGGYGRACETSASCTLSMCMCGPPARKVDEYGDVYPGDEKARLDYAYRELQNDPTAQGYLVCYGGRRGRADEARRRCGRASNYLVSTRRVDASRVVTVDGGRRDEPATEFWLVPYGATPPTASPTVDPPPARRGVDAPTPARRRRGRP